MKYIDTLREQVESMITGFVQTLPALGIAIIVLVATWIVARFAAHFADRVTRHAHMRESLKQLVETLARLGIWVLGILIALTVAMPGLEPASLIAGLGIGALAIGFAFQDIFENFLAGVLIMVREKMRIGDVIECEGITGRVEKITLRETHIRQLSNELTILPNSMLFKNAVQILTDQEIRRDSIVVGVSYDTDLEQAMPLVRSAVESIELVKKEKPVEVFAQEFNSSSIDLLVRYWTDAKPGELRVAKSQVVVAIKRALDDAGIEIPYPYVTHTFKDRVPLATAAE